MATTDYDYTSTKNNIIEAALRIIGKLYPGESVPGNIFTQASDALNDIVKDLQNQHVFLWTVSKFSLTTVAGTTSYTLAVDANGASFMALDSAFYTDADSRDYPIKIYSHIDYQGISDKDETTGQPDIIAWDRRENKLRIWPEPDAAYTVYYYAVALLKDWESLTGAGDAPVRLHRTLKYLLAADLADDFGLPISERNYISRKASEAFLAFRRMDKDLGDEEFVRGLYH